MTVSRGLRTTFDKIGDVSACLNEIDVLKTNVPKALNVPYSGKTHTTPDTSHLSWKVAKKVQALGLLTYKSNREGNEFGKLTPDLLLEGEKKLRSSSISTFNKRYRSRQEGKSVAEEIDELSLSGMVADTEGEGGDTATIS